MTITVVKPDSGRNQKKSENKSKSYCFTLSLTLCFLAVLVTAIAILSTNTTQIKSTLKPDYTRIKGLQPVSSLPSLSFNSASSPSMKNNIGSWFNTNENQVNGISNGTNGYSWCGYPYNDNELGFAISLLQMCGQAECQWTDPPWRKSTALYCGLQTWIYNPHTGINVTDAVILDAFAPLYLEDMGHGEGSIDATPALFQKLGMDPSNKMTVIFGVRWGWTGMRDMYYAAPEYAT